ncbi:hypothetical protein EB008_01610 [bacterium]|nr:hypothetical protein [bacterium]
MIPPLAPLARSLPNRTPLFLAKAPSLKGFFSSAYRPASLDNYASNRHILCRLNFGHVCRLFHDSTNSSGELHKNGGFDRYLIKDLIAIFQFPYSPNLSVRENLKKAPNTLQKQISFLICMENLAQLKKEEGFNFQDIQENPLLSKQIFEAQNLSLFKFPQAVIDILNGPSSPLKEKVADEISKLHDFQLESFSPIFQKNPAILEKLCASQIIKARQISLSFFLSHDALMDFVKKQPQTALEFLMENLRNKDLFTKEELLSIAQAHKNPYAFTKFFLFDPKSLKVLDEMAKNSPSIDTRQEYARIHKDKKLGKTASTLCKMFIVANLLILGAVLKEGS